jgi:hypothetical protein
MVLVERLLGEPTEIRATRISDALSPLVDAEKGKADQRLVVIRDIVKKLSAKDWKQELLKEEGIYIIIAERK